MYNNTFYVSYKRPDIKHHGIKGQRWGIRRFQNPDGSLTPAGQRRYGKDFDKLYTKAFGNENRVNVKDTNSLLQNTKFTFAKEIFEATDSVSKDPEMKKKYEEYDRLKNKALDNAIAKAQKKYESPNEPGAKEEVLKTLSKDTAAKQARTLLKEIQTIKNKSVEYKLRNTLGDMYDRPINSPANRKNITYGQYAYNVANTTINDLLKYRNKWDDIDL